MKLSSYDEIQIGDSFLFYERCNDEIIGLHYKLLVLGIVKSKSLGSISFLNAFGAENGYDNGKVTHTFDWDQDILNLHESDSAERIIYTFDDGECLRHILMETI